MSDDPGTCEVPAPDVSPGAPVEQTSASPVKISKPSKKANITTLKTELANLGLDTTGKKETLFKRLLAAFIQSKETKEVTATPRPRPHRQPYLSFLCFDVEATCEAGTNFDYPNEIIEFPVVLLQWTEDDSETSASRSDGPDTSPLRTRRLTIIDTFHTFVRPTWRPQLSEFCTSLTGIQQSTVDAAPTFPEVLVMLEDWLDSWGLRDGDRLRDALWVTDGPWDLRDFMPKQLHITPVDPAYPPYLYGPYLNIKAGVSNVLADAAEDASLRVRGFKGTTAGKRKQVKDFKGPNRWLDIPGQLEALGLGTFCGRQHSGIDDATNIARILIALTERDILIEPNATLPQKSKRFAWMGKPGEILHDEPFNPGLTPLPKAVEVPVATEVPPPAADPVVDDSTATPAPIVSKKAKKKKKATSNPLESPAALADVLSELAIRPGAEVSTPAPGLSA